MAAADYFLKIDGIEGESKDTKHPSELEIESFSWGATQSGSFSSQGGGGAGKVSMQDFHFVVKNGKASPKLMEACATGQHIKQSLLTCRKAGGKQEEYLKVKFSDCLISSFQTGGSGSDILPLDQISFNFSKLEYEYFEQKADGSLAGVVKTGYDLKANKKL
jgi:type VI secretion system secreted protein Hcp